MRELYEKGFNIKSTQITDGMRVSTGVFISGTIAGPYAQVETFIFHPQGERSPMKIHGTYNLVDDAREELPEYLKVKALKAHDAYVRFYMRRYSK